MIRWRKTRLIASNQTVRCSLSLSGCWWAFEKWPDPNECANESKSSHHGEDRGLHTPVLFFVTPQNPIFTHALTRDMHNISRIFATSHRSLLVRGLIFFRCAYLRIFGSYCKEQLGTFLMVDRDHRGAERCTNHKAILIDCAWSRSSSMQSSENSSAYVFAQLSVTYLAPFLCTISRAAWLL
jgi:hypothetical protein